MSDPEPTPQELERQAAKVKAELDRHDKRWNLPGSERDMAKRLGITWTAGDSKEARDD